MVLPSAAVASAVMLAAAAVVISRSGGVPAAASGTKAFGIGALGVGVSGSGAPGSGAPGGGAPGSGAAGGGAAGMGASSAAGPNDAGRHPSPAAGPSTAAMSAGTAVTLALSPIARQACPAAATACVDLADHLTWLQSGDRITYGPVRMEPGPSGQHATPRGTFRVSWKGGPNVISNVYHEPMPYAVFFAPGGIAFHGGSLTVPSHGCVHLTMANARYYNEHLPIGAEVVVF